MIKVFDATLRDGSHAIRQQFTAEDIRLFARGAEQARLPLITVGHGNGLGASSLQVGLSKLTDRQMLEVANEQLANTRLGVFVLPGFGTIRDIKEAQGLGANTVMVGCHSTEANVTRKHIEYVVKSGGDAYGVLMLSHWPTANELLEQAKLMQGYGAKGVLLMDSAGAYLPDDVETKVKTLVDGLDISVGFHSHNNLGLAVANTLTAVKSGAGFIDCTVRGLGAGAGNCQLEVAVAVLDRMGYQTGIRLRDVMDLSEDVVAPIMARHQHQQVIDKTSLSSGLAGIFSGFKTHAEKAAKQFGVDVYDIFMELGRRGAVAGQEDLIVEIAKELHERK